jgi:hypothetical protein
MELWSDGAREWWSDRVQKYLRLVFLLFLMI